MWLRGRVGLISRKGSERTLAAPHNDMNQVVIDRPKFRPLSERWAAGAVNEIIGLLVLDVLSNPKIEVIRKRLAEAVWSRGRGLPMMA